MIKDDNFDKIIEIYKSLELNGKRETLVEEFKDFLVIISKLNEISNIDNSIIYNKVLNENINSMNEDEFLVIVYSYLNMVKELFSNLGEMIIE